MCGPTGVESCCCCCVLVERICGVELAVGLELETGAGLEYILEEVSDLGVDVRLPLCGV